MVMSFSAVGSCRPLLEARGLASVQHDAVTMWWTIPSPLTRAGAMPSGLVMSPMCPRPLQPLNNAISDGSLDREWSGWLSARQRGKWTTATLFFSTPGGFFWIVLQKKKIWNLQEQILESFFSFLADMNVREIFCKEKSRAKVNTVKKP